MTRQGYSYNPVEAPREAKPSNQKWDMGGWGCSKRLFSDVQFKSNDTESATKSVELKTQLPVVENPGNFLTCAIMEMKPISLSDNSRTNRVYAKSEVVVKGENYGWVMWTFVSTLPTKTSGSSSYSNSLDFIYRLVTLKKDSNKWEIVGGVSWSHYSVAGSLNSEKLIIAPPLDQQHWFTEKNPRGHTDSTPFQERVWSGMGEVDNDSESTSKGLFQSIEIYNKGSNYSNPEVWGSDGNFDPSSSDTQGYDYVNIYYDKEGGWKQKSSGENLSSELGNWYKPFREKKIKWSGLWDKCNAWSKNRNKQTSFLDENLQALCYHK